MASKVKDAVFASVVYRDALCVTLSSFTTCRGITWRGSDDNCRRFETISTQPRPRCTCRKVGLRHEILAALRRGQFNNILGLTVLKERRRDVFDERSFSTCAGH